MNAPSRNPHLIYGMDIGQLVTSSRYFENVNFEAPFDHDALFDGLVKAVSAAQGSAVPELRTKLKAAMQAIAKREEVHDAFYGGGQGSSNAAFPPLFCHSRSCSGCRERFNNTTPWKKGDRDLTAYGRGEARHVPVYNRVCSSCGAVHSLSYWEVPEEENGKWRRRPLEVEHRHRGACAVRDHEARYKCCVSFVCGGVGADLFWARRVAADISENSVFDRAAERPRGVHVCARTPRPPSFESF